MPRLPPPGRTFGSCQPGAWRYHELSTRSGSMCLDGSPYGFYFIDGVPTRREPPTMRFNDSWLLLFEGGGWCWSPEDCALRASGKLGSSLSWPKGNITIGGLVNRCCFCTKFCRFRRVYLKSCDGHSFSGNASIAAPRERPAGVPSTMHSAGRAILRAVVKELVTHFGLANAKSVLIAGCSAGGLSALLNAEWLRDEMLLYGIRPRRFKVASLAGVFFTPHTFRSSVLSARTGVLLSPFEEQLRAAVDLGRMKLPARCTDRMPSSEHWRCLFDMAPLEALPNDLPAFVYQSRLDLWQTNCVLAAGRSRFFALNCSNTRAWRQCLGWMQPLRSSSRCAPEQWAALRMYEERNHDTLVQSPVLHRNGYGSFIHSCFDHCPSTYGLINTGASLRPGTVNDSINLRESLHLWFLDEESDRVPAWNHTHIGCWNGAVANRVPDKMPPPWCRRTECGAPEKMHHDETASMLGRVRKYGWVNSWDRA